MPPAIPPVSPINHPSVINPGSGNQGVGLTPAVPYFQQTYVLPAGEGVAIPGQFTWVEFLSEFQTLAPTVNAQDVQIAFYTSLGMTTLPPGIRVSAIKGQDFVNMQLLNTNESDSITVTVCAGTGMPARDSRIVLPVGTFIDAQIVGPLPLPVTVENDNTDPIPTVAVNAQENKVPVGAVPCIGTDCFNVTVTTNLFGAGANVNGAVIDILKLACDGTGGANAALTIFSGAGSGAPLGISENQLLVAPNPIYIPPGWAATITIAAGGQADGSFRLL
jgi:hypothetical protein